MELKAKEKAARHAEYLNKRFGMSNAADLLDQGMHSFLAAFNAQNAPDEKKARSVGDKTGRGPTPSSTPRIEPDIHKRLAAYQQTLGVPPAIHAALEQRLGQDGLETIYSSAVVELGRTYKSVNPASSRPFGLAALTSGESAPIARRKALSGVEHFALIHQTALDIGVPEPVVNALSRNLGPNGYEQTIRWLSDVGFWRTKGLK